MCLKLTEIVEKILNQPQVKIVGEMVDGQYLILRRTINDDYKIIDQFSEKFIALHSPQET